MVVVLTVLIRVTCFWRRNSESYVCVCVCVCVQFKKLKWGHYAGNLIFESGVRDRFKLLI